ncbi:MAG: hypothetical protein U9P10_15105 [Thermodesulfobacteriota bacterium]|nr:hypothetical protein [Thermodesulfobacteriota bacterium]
MINKINQFTELVTGTKKQQSSSDGELFQKTLDKALEKQGASEMQTTSSLGEISSVAYPIKTTAPGLADRTDELIGMLEIFSEKLQDPDNSLKKIQTMMEEIKINADNLLKETQSSDAGTVLKDIALECALAANTEYAKFYRGDYV